MHICPPGVPVCEHASPYVMERLEPPAQWVSIPVQEFERLRVEARRSDTCWKEVLSLRAEVERLRAGWDEAQAYMALSLEREATLQAEIERVRADNTFAGDATERLLAGIKRVHSLVSFGFVGDAKQELEALLSGSGGSDRA